MYTENFEEKILFAPARKEGQACSHLKIVTAFTDVERISSHLIRLYDGRNKEYTSNLKIDIILGMTKGAGLTFKKHQRICSLTKRLNSVSGIPAVILWKGNRFIPRFMSGAGEIKRWRHTAGQPIIR